MIPGAGPVVEAKVHDSLEKRFHLIPGKKLLRLLVRRGKQNLSKRRRLTHHLQKQLEAKESRFLLIRLSSLLLRLFHSMVLEKNVKYCSMTRKSIKHNSLILLTKRRLPKKFQPANLHRTWKRLESSKNTMKQLQHRNHLTPKPKNLLTIFLKNNLDPVPQDHMLLLPLRVVVLQVKAFEKRKIDKNHQLDHTESVLEAVRDLNPQITLKKSDENHQLELDHTESVLQVIVVRDLNPQTTVKNVPKSRSGMQWLLKIVALLHRQRCRYCASKILRALPQKNSRQAASLKPARHRRFDLNQSHQWTTVRPLAQASSTRKMRSRGKHHEPRQKECWMPH